MNLKSAALSYLFFWLAYNVYKFTSMAGGIPYNTDFNHYYAGGRLLADGVNPYCLPLSKLPFDLVWDPKIPYVTNTPFHNLIMVPFAFFSVEISWLIWILTICLCGIWAVRITMSILPSLEQNNNQVLAWTVFFASYGLLDNFIYSQIQLMILFLAVLGWKWFRQTDYEKAAAVWGLALAIKPLTFLLLVQLAAMRKWKALAVGVFTFAAANIATMIIAGPEIFSSYLDCSVQIVSTWRTQSLLNISLWGFLYRCGLLLGIDSGGFHWHARTVIIMSALLMSFVIGRKKIKSSREHDLSFVLHSTFGFFLLDVAWPSYLVIVFPALAVLWHYKLAGRLTGTTVFTFWAVLSLKPFYECFLESRDLGLLRSLVPSIAVMLVVAMFCYFLLRSTPSNQSS